jgi:amphi-Trp domain-containing protein
MAKDKFEYARIASPEEVADYLTALAAGFERGEVTLEPGTRTLRLSPDADLKLELAIKDKPEKGKVAIEIAWKQRLAARATDLRVASGSR